MANVRKLLSLLKQLNDEEIESLSSNESEEIEGGANCDIGCRPNESCNPQPVSFQI
jgi:hypothetical protein